MYTHSLRKLERRGWGTAGNSLGKKGKRISPDGLTRNDGTEPGRRAEIRAFSRRGQKKREKRETPIQSKKSKPTLSSEGLEGDVTRRTPLNRGHSKTPEKAKQIKMECKTESRWINQPAKGGKRGGGRNQRRRRRGKKILTRKSLVCGNIPIPSVSPR